jgi:hypothetical protein
VKAQCGFDYWALPVSHPSKWLSNGAARDVRAAINAACADLPTDLRSNPIYRSVNLFIERRSARFSCCSASFCSPANSTSGSAA